MQTKFNYIGITGFKSPYQVKQAIQVYERTSIANAPGMHLMIGLLISGRNRDPAWESSRYPRYGDFKDMMNVRGNTFVTLHMDAKKSDRWYLDLLYLVDKFPLMGFDGFQINVKHPDPLDIVSLKNQFPDKKIILQYSKDFLDRDPDVAVKELETYSRFIDFVLIDPSRGRGESIDMDLARHHYVAIKQNVPQLGVGFAGGFTPESISSIVGGMAGKLESVDFSIDIETGVRDSNDKLDMQKIEQYINEASRAYLRGREDCYLTSPLTCTECRALFYKFLEDHGDCEHECTCDEEGS